jgi:hypothetical protein
MSEEIETEMERKKKKKNVPPEIENPEPVICH